MFANMVLLKALNVGKPRLGAWLLVATYMLDNAGMLLVGLSPKWVLNVSCGLELNQFQKRHSNDYEKRIVLVLLRHEVTTAFGIRLGAVQHGHRLSRVVRATINRRRIVVIEFGICRSVLSGLRLASALKSAVCDDGRGKA